MWRCFLLRASIKFSSLWSPVGLVLFFPWAFAPCTTCKRQPPLNRKCDCWTVMLFCYVRWKAVFSWNLLNKMCHSILLLNVNFAFADVRPVWKVTIVNNDTTVALCWKCSPTQTFSFNTLLCGSLQNVLKVTEHDAFISCSGMKCIWVFALIEFDTCRRKTCLLWMLSTQVCEIKIPANSCQLLQVGGIFCIWRLWMNAKLGSPEDLRQLCKSCFCLS